jgi:hypothetical protein
MLRGAAAHHVSAARQSRGSGDVMSKCAAQRRRGPEIM